MHAKIGMDFLVCLLTHLHGACMHVHMHAGDFHDRLLSLLVCWSVSFV